MFMFPQDSAKSFHRPEPKVQGEARACFFREKLLHRPRSPGAQELPSPGPGSWTIPGKCTLCARAWWGGVSPAFLPQVQAASQNVGNVYFPPLHPALPGCPGVPQLWPSEPSASTDQIGDPAPASLRKIQLCL